jgi:hypothetical protein
MFQSRKLHRALRPTLARNQFDLEQMLLIRAVSAFLLFRTRSFVISRSAWVVMPVIGQSTRLSEFTTSTSTCRENLWELVLPSPGRGHAIYR